MLEIDISKAREEIMLRRVVEIMKDFYRNPKNLKAFEAWQKRKSHKE